MPRITRPPVKQQEIVHWIRARIQSGDLPPATRLPTRQVIESQFGVSSLTVQRAFRHLLHDGYVETVGRSGTFVARLPPHRHQVGIVVPGTGMDLDGTNLVSVLLRQVRALDGWRDWRCRVYLRVVPNQARGDYAQLLDDLHAHRLAGLIFAVSPFLLDGTPILTTPGVPRIAYSQGYRGVANVFFDYPAWIARAVDHLVAQGCQRLALIGPFLQGDYAQPAFQAALAAHGRAFRAADLQMVAPSSRRWAANVAALYMALAPDERPDGLLVADDNLIGPVCDGIRAALNLPAAADAVDAAVLAGAGDNRPTADWRVPRIVAHCNFPDQPAVSLPVTWLGFDVPALLRHSLEAFRLAADGVPLTMSTALRPQFARTTPAATDVWVPGALPPIG